MKREPFMIAPRSIVQDRSLEKVDIQIYLALDGFANREGLAWPSIGTLAEHCDVSSSTVKRGLTRLEQAGYIIRQKRKKADGGWNSNIYRINFRTKGKPMGDGINESKSEESTILSEHDKRVNDCFEAILEIYPLKKQALAARRDFAKLFPVGKTNQFYDTLFKNIYENAFKIAESVATGKTSCDYVPLLRNFLTREDFSRNPEPQYGEEAAPRYVLVPDEEEGGN